MATFETKDGTRIYYNDWGKGRPIVGLQSMLAGMPAAYFCVKAFSENDTTEDLKKIGVPILFLHGDDDQIVPNRCLRPIGLQDRARRKAQNL